MVQSYKLTVYKGAEFMTRLLFKASGAHEAENIANSLAGEFLAWDSESLPNGVLAHSSNYDATYELVQV